ncbi:response regulator [Vibrio sp. STUT-A11]|uniref:response regulator n=1 Tax=Vibrio sp. STUT-A11 TaxID=2976236 RepID=UPI0022309EF0|nr:response regulator [Vibrio sp. STUT-A11]BDR16163.1 hybrid sensor histidine kinase/response regulator [Vibrio sp. STUT-A11]|eukprot:Anaeramoba_flamelloidesa810095_35.p1 GENE.a810095_35~~a810095_35.p1  ORF type:complete len:697 (-),score=6.93 a810095_35:142-2232(-)
MEHQSKTGKLGNTDAIRKVYQYAAPNLTLVGWLGFIGFPLYYLVWEVLFPQTYENFSLRLFCSLLFLGIIFRNRFPPFLYRYIHIYYQVTITLCLPFFFFYMLLMNDWSEVWVMSFMCAIFLHILLVHLTKVMFVQTFVGVALAFFFAWVAKGFQIDITMNWAHVPIFLFIYVFGNLFYVRNQIEHESKVSLAKYFGAGIAHEMRNPLSGLSTSIELIRSILPSKKTADKDQYVMSGKDVALLNDVSQDAMNIIHSANETIDLLLTSIDENRISRSTFKKHSAKNVVQQAIESFSYDRVTDKRVISLDVEDEFYFLGSNTLLQYVMYNLFKNSFHHRSPEDFHILVELKNEGAVNKIIVTDNGSGIASDVIGNVFEDFYTTGQSKNYGLGLPFCKKVMCSYGGSIEAKSVLGEWTQFTLTFPSLNSEVVTRIKQELTTLKKVLMVTDQDILVCKGMEMSSQMDFSLNCLQVNEALNQKQHEFNYDAIFVDLHSLGGDVNQLKQLEALFTYSEARIVYLFERHPASRVCLPVNEAIWVETQAWLLNTANTIDQVLFDSRDTTSLSDHGEVAALAPAYGRTIMVVDDNESLRKFTAILLEKQGFAVIQKENGQQAVEALETDSVDVILMDIEMPVMDGIEASRVIRKSNKHYSSVPIIAYTGDSTAFTLDKIGSSGMSDFIVKPANKTRLLDKIANWV